MTTALNTIFKEQGQKVDSIKVALPANLRFKFYKSRYHVKMENKFAVLPVTVPLSDTTEQAYSKISKATKSLKSSMGILYAMYALSFWVNKLFSRSIARNMAT